MKKTAIIIGAGPAGLTAAYELLDRTDYNILIFEATSDIGGISKTVNYKGNRIDIGGHRFFSKSDRVMQWWQNILPLPGRPSRDDILLGRDIPLAKEGRRRPLGKKEEITFSAPDPKADDFVMLVRKRISRILFLRKFFNYPITLNFETVKNLGLARIFKIGISYLWICLFPIKPELSLEDFFINRFGRELYETFFKDYTEKVWGVPCREIKPEWGAQRVKGLSITKTILHALKNLFASQKSIEQKEVETSLIEQFLYPKYGPGQMWETVADAIKKAGGEIHFGHRVVGLKADGNHVISSTIEKIETGETIEVKGDLFFSSMPVKNLVQGFNPEVPSKVMEIANGLVYRDFITVGLLLKKLKVQNTSKIKTVHNIVPDNWIYVQERDVKLGRIQIFNNWSPYMVKNGNNVWIGLEYFCNEGDFLWEMPNDVFARFAIDELEKINFITKEDVLDYTVIRMPKTYPAYFGTYDRFHVIKDYLDPIENLFLIGRNGMHRYNNTDHSMLTAMVAVDNIVAGIKNKENIWAVNTEEEYHEEK